MKLYDYLKSLDLTVETSHTFVCDDLEPFVVDVRGDRSSYTDEENAVFDKLIGDITEFRAKIASWTLFQLGDPPILEVSKSAITALTHHIAAKKIIGLADQVITVENKITTTSLGHLLFSVYVEMNVFE